MWSVQTERIPFFQFQCRILIPILSSRTSAVTEMRFNGVFKGRIRSDEGSEHGMLDRCFDEAHVVELAATVAFGSALPADARLVVHGLWHENQALDGNKNLESGIGRIGLQCQDRSRSVARIPKTCSAT